jgi:MFS family permease
VREALAPLQQSPFGRLLTTYSLNRLGDYVGVVALASLVYAETRSALATTALFLAMELLPAFFAPVLTARVDSRDFKRVLPALYVLEAIFFAALAIVASDFALPLVLVLAFLDGVLMLTARGLTRGAVAAVLEPVGLLRAGNGLLNLAFALAGVLGAGIGGLLTSEIGASSALLVNASTFLVVALVLVIARRIPGADTSARPDARRLREGLGFVRRNAALRVLLTAEGAALVLLTVIVPIEVVYAYETLDSDEAGYGALMASWSAGLLAGSALFLRIRSVPLVGLALGATALIGAAYLGMGLVRTLVAACALAVVGGLGNGIQWVAVTTAVQERTPATFQARTSGLLESIASAATGVGFVLGGVVVTLAEPHTAFLIAGSGIIVGTFAVAIVMLRPRRRQAAPSGGA